MINSKCCGAGARFSCGLLVQLILILIIVQFWIKPPALYFELIKLFQIISDDRRRLCFWMVVHSSDQVETQCSGVISNEEHIYNVNGYEYMDIQSEMKGPSQASSLAMNTGSHSWCIQCLNVYPEYNSGDSLKTGKQDLCHMWICCHLPNLRHLERRRQRVQFIIYKAFAWNKSLHKLKWTRPLGWILRLKKNSIIKNSSSYPK